MRTSDTQSELFYSFVRSPRLERTSSNNGRQPEPGLVDSHGVADADGHGGGLWVESLAIDFTDSATSRSSHVHDNHHLDSSGDTTTREHAASTAKRTVSSIVAELSNGAHSTKEEGHISPSVMRRFCANTFLSLRINHGYTSSLRG